LDEEVTIIEILALLLLLLLLLSVVHLLRCAVGGLKPELRWGSCCFSFNDLRECAVKEEHTRDMVCVFLILHFVQLCNVIQCVIQLSDIMKCVYVHYGWLVVFYSTENV